MFDMAPDAMCENFSKGWTAFDVGRHLPVAAAAAAGVLRHTADVALDSWEVPLLAWTAQRWLWCREVPEHGMSGQGQLPDLS